MNNVEYVKSERSTTEHYNGTYRHLYSIADTGEVNITWEYIYVYTIMHITEVGYIHYNVYSPNNHRVSPTSMTSNYKAKLY